MKTSHRITLLVTAGTVLLAATYVFTRGINRRNASDPHTLLAPGGKIEIVRHPPPSVALRNRGALAELPVYAAHSGKGWQVDLRGRDVRGVDLDHRLKDLRQASFDRRTRWPARLPAGFAPDAILELNKNPGLGVRQLHARGITGRGVGLGIIDQTLLVDHVEYAHRLRSYEEIHLYGDDAQMHGPAVASIAVGRNVGVAPDADLYYIAETLGTYAGRGHFEWDFTPLARSIDRLLEINRRLPPDRKIRVISVSVGFNPTRPGFNEVMEAVARAARANVFVLTCAVDRTHKLAFHGLGREQTSDPDCVDSYGPGSWWADSFWGGHDFRPGKQLLVPMDARTVASPAGEREYVYYSHGGWSWSVPWIAGLYALACQVRPEITPELFWAEALRTGRTISLSHHGATLEFGTIADPPALIGALECK
jgi:hypothetical protein